MKRTGLKNRKLPDYTRGEEIFNMVSHIVGGAFGIVALVLCLITSILKGNPWSIVSSVVYGVSMVLLYTMSSVYHGLLPEMAKKVMQVLDHCTIYLLIAGTYTPIALCAIRPGYPAWGWALFGGVWAIAIVAIVFTAIDLKKYAVLSMICYIGMGWCVVLAADPVLKTIPVPGLIWLLAGGHRLYDGRYSLWPGPGNTATCIRCFTCLCWQGAFCTLCASSSISSDGMKKS